MGRTIAITNTLGHVDITHYDALGRVDWTARNATTPLQFDAYSQPVYHAYSRLFPDRNVNTLYGYDGLGRTAFLTETGILTGTFDAATLRFSDVTTRTTRTEYDTLSRPVTVTLNYRPGLPSTADTNIQLYTRYDGASNVITQTDPLGRWTVNQYDALNRPITVTLNYDDGDPLTGPADADVKTVTRYDMAGRVERQIDNYVNGAFTATEPITDRITLYQYDTLSRAITTTLNYDPPTLLTRTDTNRASVTAYDPLTTRVLGTRDALGRWVSQQYDLLGRLETTVQNCTGTSAPNICGSQTAEQNVAMSTHYDALGRTFETVDALGHVTHTTFDGLGRGTATVQNSVAGGPTTAITNVTTLTGYDGLGQTTVMTDALGYTTQTTYNGLSQTTIITDSVGRVTRLGYDGSGTLRWTKRNDGQLTAYHLDGLGRVVATIVNYQDGIVGVSEPTDQNLITQTVYDAAGRRLRTIDPAGSATALTYDTLDRLITVTEHALTGTCTNPPCNVVTRYQYDRAGNRTAIIDANDHTRRFSYNAANQQISATDALARTTSWEYDAGGRMTVQHDPRGISDTLSFSYDGLDRQTQIAATNLFTISAQYDPLGRRLSLSDGSGTTGFAYDPLGRMARLNAPHTGTVDYGYDANGQRTQLTYPGGTILTYGYWPDGRLHTLTDTTTLASYTYDSVGRPQQVTRVNGTTTTYSYDGADRLTDLHTQAGSTTHSRFNYTLDRLGHRTQATETLAAATRVISYTYDGLRRLTNATESPGNTYFYSYDLAGNRTLIGSGNVAQLYMYNAANEAAGWTYDDVGNLTGDGTTSYSYDALNRLTQAGSTSYTYNGDGALVHDGTTRYVQDLAAPLSQMLQATNGVTTTYLYGAERLAAVQGSTRTWYSGDGLGSVRQTLSNSGGVLSSINYDPWGTVESGTVYTFGFTGEQHDPATGLVNLRARWYSTSHGRFTAFRWRADESDDTIPYSHHPYAYALGDPVLYTDPAGEYACDSAVGYGYNPYAVFCHEQQQRLDRELNIDDPGSVIKTWPLTTLISLFNDPQLPGGSGEEARSFRNQLLTPAAERLQFVLWYTRGVGRFAHDRLNFSDIDFAQEFRDANHWSSPDGTPYVSNQVNHFLTAVDLAYRSELLTKVPPMLCLIGHEKYGQGTKPEWYQCSIGVSTFELFDFINAIRADSEGDYATRDCLIAQILPDLPENEYRGRIDLDDRRGNSRQDLRLSIKGWRFGQLIRDGVISTLEEAGSWLTRNLAP